MGFLYRNIGVFFSYIGNIGDIGGTTHPDLYSLLFSVGRNDAGEEEKRTPRKTTARRRKSLVAEARSRHLKVGSKTSTEIQRMLSRDKRTQPRMLDNGHPPPPGGEEEGGGER